MEVAQMLGGEALLIFHQIIMSHSFTQLVRVLVEGRIVVGVQVGPPRAWWPARCSCTW